MKPEKHFTQHEIDTPTLESELKARYEKKGKGLGWKKWLSISSITAVAAVLVAIPIIREMTEHTRSVWVSPDTIKEEHDSRVEAEKHLQDEIVAIKTSLERRDKVAQETTQDTRDRLMRIETQVGDINSTLNRILDNQEHPHPNRP